jgi:hypothetical protein
MEAADTDIMVRADEGSGLMLRPELLTGEQAERDAKTFARDERDRLDKSCA